MNSLMGKVIHEITSLKNYVKKNLFICVFSGKERRDQAMTSQAEMILKKKREIEAKMAADEKKEKMAGQPRKPISMSISKRW